MFRWLFILLFFTAYTSVAQPIVWPNPEVEQLYNDTRRALSTGNFRSAITGFQQVIKLAPEVMQPYRDLGNAYYLSGNYSRADETLKSIIDRGVADDQTYSVAASSLAAQHEDKKARKMLERGIDKFPGSGLLYHDYGKLYDDVNDEEAALKKWLEGIKAAPAYRVNYYEAARTYMISNKPVWAILYGEIFINMEPQTPRSGETRKMLLAAYRKLFTTPSEDAPRYGSRKSSKEPRSFEEAVTQTFMGLAPIVGDGITTENLTMLRTRFSLEWEGTLSARYPYTLFHTWDMLLRDGHFDAYNQWLFGKAENVQQYEAWTKFHAESIPGWQTYAAAHPLTPVAGDAYNEGNTKGIFPKAPSKR